MTEQEKVIQLTQYDLAAQLAHSFESIRELRDTVDLLACRVEQIGQMVSLIQDAIANQADK